MRCARLLLPALIVLAAHHGTGAEAAEQEVTSRVVWEDPSDAPALRAPPSRDLQDALAHVVIERNRVSTERDTLLQQRWLILIYAVGVSLLAGWAAHALLQRRRPRRVEEVADDPKRTKANATITIRNANQQVEVTGRVATRTFFRRRTPAEVTTTLIKAGSPPPAPATTVPASTPPPEPATTRRTTTPEPARPVTAAPTESVFRKPIAPPPRREATEYPPSDQTPTRTQIGTQESILLSLDIDESDPQESTSVRIARRAGHELARQGLSLLEVMISLAILATILASVSSGIFSLGSAKRSADEQAMVSDVMRMWSERIIGADWEWLGRDRSDDPLRGAWSWPRPETTAALGKDDHPPLSNDAPEPIHQAHRQVLGSDTPSTLKDLRLYLDYYRPVALEMGFTPLDAKAARTAWQDTRAAFRLTPPIDLRLHNDAVVVRLSATWTAHTGGTQHRETIFARTR